jgi:hypothetical protein
LDLKEKYLDNGVLKIICEAVEKNVKCANNQQIFSLKPKILKLFGRIVTVVS